MVDHEQRRRDIAHAMWRVIARDGLAAASRLTLATERLAGEEARRLLDLAAATVRGVVYGILGTALAQGTLAGIGFAIAGAAMTYKVWVLVGVGLAILLISIIAWSIEPNE